MRIFKKSILNMFIALAMFYFAIVQVRAHDAGIDGKDVAVAAGIVAGAVILDHALDNRGRHYTTRPYYGGRNRIVMNRGRHFSPRRNIRHNRIRNRRFR